MGPGGRTVLGHPPLLLGGAQADKHHVRLRGFHSLRHGGSVLEIPVVGPADDQVRVGLF